MERLRRLGLPDPDHPHPDRLIPLAPGQLLGRLDPHADAGQADLGLPGRPPALLLDLDHVAADRRQAAAQSQQLGRAALPVGAFDQHAAVLAGADQGLVAQLYRGVQGLEDVGAAVADIDPEAALRRPADPLEAALPQGGFTRPCLGRCISG